MDDLKIKISYFSLFFSFFIYLKEERKKFSKSFYSKIYTLIIGNIGKSKNFICFFFFICLYSHIRKKFLPNRCHNSEDKFSRRFSRSFFWKVCEIELNFFVFYLSLLSFFPSILTTTILSIFLLRLVNSIIMSVRLRVSVDYVVVRCTCTYFLLLIDFLTIVAGLFRPRGCWGCNRTASRSNCFSCCP